MTRDFRQATGAVRSTATRVCPRALARQVSDLAAASRNIDYDDAAAEAAYYAKAAPVVEAVIAFPAECLPGFRLKAEAVAWTAGGSVALGPTPTPMERLVESLLRDLRSAPTTCSGCLER